MPRCCSTSMKCSSASGMTLIQCGHGICSTGVGRGSAPSIQGFAWLAAHAKALVRSRHWLVQTCKTASSVVCKSFRKSDTVAQFGGARCYRLGAEVYHNEEGFDCGCARWARWRWFVAAGWILRGEAPHRASSRPRIISYDAHLQQAVTKPRR